MSWCNQICQFTLQYSIIPIKCTNTTVLTLFCKHFFFYQSFTHFYQEIVTVWLQYINQFHFKFYTTSQNFIRSHLFSWTRPLYVCLKKVASWETTACIITSFVMWHEELLPQLLFFLPSLFTTALCCASLSLCSISLNVYYSQKRVPKKNNPTFINSHVAIYPFSLCETQHWNCLFMTDLQIILFTTQIPNLNIMQFQH